MIKVRLEEEQDYHIVEEVTKEAFSYAERIERSKIGCCLEHYMIHSLREKDGINELSFVAEIEGKVVGHIIYSKAYILKPNGIKVNVLNFGPLSVQPEYYPRFGFVDAKEFEITDSEGYNYPAFMAMELKKDYLKDVTGKFCDAPIYNDDLNREEAKIFDDQFCRL